MHQDAVLPPFCVKTGEPARRVVYVDAIWLCRSFKIYIGRAETCCPVWRNDADSSSVDKQSLDFPRLPSSLFALPGSVLGAYLAGVWRYPAAFLAAALCLGLVIWAFAVGDPISFVLRRDYHWLREQADSFWIAAAMAAVRLKSDARAVQLQLSTAPPRPLTPSGPFWPSPFRPAIYRGFPNYTYNPSLSPVTGLPSRLSLNL